MTMSMTINLIYNTNISILYTIQYVILIRMRVIREESEKQEIFLLWTSEKQFL